MAAYIIANVDVKDAERIKEYTSATPEVISKYNGRFIVRGGDVTIVEGTWKPKRLVVLEFDTLENAKAFWHSEDYQPLKELRQQLADTEMIIVDGISDELKQQLGYQ